MQNSSRTLQVAFLAALAIFTTTISAEANTHKRHHAAHKPAAAKHSKAKPFWVEQVNGCPAGHTCSTKNLVRPYSSAVFYHGGGDYLAQTEGESRWPGGHTIRVYVGPGRSTYPGIVAKCFDEWSRATGGRIHYTLVSSPSQADYFVTWTSRQREVSEGTEAGLTTTDTYVDSDSGQELIDRARTSILTRYDGRMLPDKDIAETVLHEIGHGLGIEGHSSNPYDIMYYAVSSKQSGHLTGRDANTIAHLYQ